MSAAQWAALGAGLILVGMAGLQAALALGAPLGRFAWGGRHRGVLPARLQLGSALSIPVLFGMAAVLAIRAGLIYPGWSAGMGWPAWGVFLFLVTNMFGNLASESREERLVMGPAACLAALLALVVAWE